MKLVTVKDGGGWHVSLGYTIAEAIRGDGPAPDFAAAPVPVGSDSPDGAVRDLVAAAEARDLRKVVSLMAPDEDKALYAYASLFVGKPVSSDSDPSVEISKLELSVTGSGSTRLVRIKTFAVKLVTGDATMTMDFDGKCSTVQTTYPDGYFSTTPDLEPSFMSNAERKQFEAEQAQEQAQLEEPHRTCAGEAPADGGAADIGTLGALGTSVQDFAITVVQIDGRWYVSPVRTLLDTVDRALQKLTPADLDKYGKWFSDETSGSSSSEFVPVAPAIGTGTRKRGRARARPEGPGPWSASRAARCSTPTAPSPRPTARSCSPATPATTSCWFPTSVREPTERSPRRASWRRPRRRPHRRRRSPARPPRSGLRAGSEGLDEDGVALAAAAAEGGRAESAAAAGQLVEDVQRDAGAGHAHGVAEGDGAAVDVDDLGRDAQVGHRGHADGGEGLVELEQVDVADRDAGPLGGRLDGPGRLGEQRRVGPGHLAVADDLAERLDAELLGLGLAT